MFRLAMVTKVKNVKELESDDAISIQGDYPKQNISPRLNVNDLLKRKEKAEKAEKAERITNILIVSGVTSVILVILVIMNL